MKLDSIIYDANTLQSALIEKTLDESQTFKAMYPSDTATSLMTVLSGYGSMLQYSLVSAMANCYTDTVYSETGIYQLAETLGNRLHGKVSSQISLYVERKNLLGVTNLSIPEHCVWDAEGIKFYNENPVNFANANKKLITLTQGEYKTYKGTFSGNQEERIYFSQDFACNLNTVKVLINGEEWKTTETFLPLNANNAIDNTELQYVILRMDPDGRAYIKFGNNSTGILPRSGSSVEIQYVSNDGEDGNIASDSIDIQLVTPVYHYYEGNSVPLQVECQNTTVAGGGYNMQSLDVLKETSPYVFASGNRAVSREDYKALLINKCGYITCNVWGEYEESEYNGYYDKSMMNTVFYTGIKQLQHYDYKPLGSVTNLEVAGQDLLENPYTFEGNIGTIKGFPGSYSIDFIYNLDDSKRMRYRDRFGTGILTCDPSVNNYNDSLYPFNDIGESLVNYGESRTTLVENKIKFSDYGADQSANLTRIAQNVPSTFLDNFGSSNPYSPSRTWTGDITTIFKYNTEDNQPSETGVNGNNFTFIWDGFNADNRAKNVSFANPIRIYFKFDRNCPTPISAISFRAPKSLDLLKYCPGKFSLFATNEIESVAPIDHVRNNVNWKRIIDVNKLELDVTGTEHAWSDWYTTNLYQPNITILDNQVNSEATVLYDQWQAYSRYVLEIYSLQDESLSAFGQYMIIPGIKMLYANNNEDYYAWVYSLLSDESVDPRTQFTQDTGIEEPDLVYLLYASASSEVTDQPILVKTDGEEYPDKYWGKSVSHYYIDSVKNISATSGYALNETFTVTGNAGSNATIKITGVTGTTFSISGFSLDEAGEGQPPLTSGYRENETFTITGATGDIFAKFEITSVDGAGKILNMTITEPGQYSTNPANSQGRIPSNHIIYSGTTGTGIADALRVSIRNNSGSITNLEIVHHGKFSTDITGDLDYTRYTYNGTHGTGAVLDVECNSALKRYNYSNAVYSQTLDKIYTYPYETEFNADSNTWVQTRAWNQAGQDERYFRISTPSENLNIHKELGVSLIDYESNDKVKLHIPAFPEDIKYYSYNVEVVGAGSANGYRTGERLYYSVPSADGTGESYFHVFIQNANANDGDGQVSIHYSKSLQETMSNLAMADNTKIDTGDSGDALLHMNEGEPGDGAKIIISSSPAIDIFANLTGNSYTLSETQRLDEPIIEEYNHFTTYMEFKQPRLKNVKIILNVEYEDNVNTSDVEVKIRQAVADVFKITPYFIGQNIPINKIWKAVQSVENIKRFSVAYPLEDITCEDNELLILHDSDLVIKEIVPTVYK